MLTVVVVVEDLFDLSDSLPLSLLDFDDPSDELELESLKTYVLMKIKFNSRVN